ncbi:MAG: biotin--[Clostridia bacterium]|nr:biotin--[acetyl-CoA-carboxylase] ligase [Clostridia bacterium]
VGIGVNLYHPKDNFPKDIQQIAGTVFDENIDNDLKSKFIAEIINSFFEIYNNFENSDFMKEYKQKSIIIGKKVTVIKGKDRQNAVALDIDDNARLLVEYENGEKEKLFSGEVSIKV